MCVFQSQLGRKCEIKMSFLTGVRNSFKRKMREWIIYTLLRFAWWHRLRLQKICKEWFEWFYHHISRFHKLLDVRLYAIKDITKYSMNIVALSKIKLPWMVLFTKNDSIFSLQMFSHLGIRKRNRILSKF